MPPGGGTTSTPSTFGGNGDVEQFIREFEDVTTITERPAPVRLLQLWTCLTNEAKCYGLDLNVNPRDPN